MPHSTSQRHISLALPSIRDMFPGTSMAESTMHDETEIGFVPPRLLTESPSRLVSPSPLPLRFIDSTPTSSSHFRPEKQPRFRVNIQPSISASSTNTETSVMVNHCRSLASTFQLPLTSTISTRNFPNPNCKREHVCPVPSCGKVFSSPFNLRNHFVVHTGAMPFECPHPKCGKRFNVVSNMRRHYKGHSKPK